MSWFAGCYHYEGFATSFKLKIPKSYDNYIEKKELHLLSDNINTFITNTDAELKIICGNILKKSQGLWKLSDEAWIPENERPEVSGHYVGMNYSAKGLEFYNDQFGLRELYYFTNEDGTLYFSTRMDILLFWKKENRFDWEEFGSYWLNRNPLGHGYFIKGIERLNQAGKLVFNNNQIEKSTTNWTAIGEEKYKPEKVNDVMNEIESFLYAPQNSGYETLFALSGGYDSRALLAKLISSDIIYEAVTWGCDNHPDVKLAREIAELTGIEHNTIFTDLLDTDESWKYFTDYCCRNQLVVMGTAVFELHHYHYLQKDKVLIDGGMGELIRRCMNANLEYRGKQAIIERDVNKILRYMTKSSADVFRDELLKKMRSGLKERAEQAVYEMPDASKIGIGNWIDTWDIRQRLSNISSRSQQTLDDIMRNFMPYVQKPVIDKAMCIPANIRSKNHIIDMMIRHNAPMLMKLPTIRNALRMRYGTGRISGKIKAIIGRKWSYKKNTNERFLNIHKDRIIEIAKDCSRNRLEIYDPVKIEGLVRNYYLTGEKEQEMIWWLSFEVFCQQFNIKQ